MAVISRGQLSLTDLNDAIIAGSPPLNPSIDTLWIDSSVTPNLLKRWSGSVWVNMGEISTVGTGTTITQITQTLGNMANDNILDYAERQIVKDKLTEILGYVITDSTTTLPTVATLDSSLKGGLYAVRKSALNAGILATNALYIAVATQYTNLKNYLDSLTPIRPWNIATANQSTNITVVKDTFRTNWLNYYVAVDALAVETSRLLKLATDNVDGRLTTVQSSLQTAINQSNSQIALKANQVTVDSLTNRVSTAESQITVQAGQISLKVNNNGVISAINLSTEGVLIQSSKLLISDWTNLIENPDFEQDTVNQLPTGYTGSATVFDISTLSSNNGSKKAMKINANTSGNSDVYANTIIPVTAGQKFFVEAEARYLSTLGTGSLRIGFQTYKADRTVNSQWIAVVEWTGAKTTVFTKKSGEFTVPANVGYIRPWFSFSTNGEATNQGFIDNIRIHRKSGAELIVDGSITATKLSVDKLSSIVSDLGSITAGSLNINNNFIVNSSGHVTAKSGVIGGLNVTATKLYMGDSGISSNSNEYAFWAGETNGHYGASTTNAKFKVGHDGILHSMDALIYGEIHAQGGTFSGNITSTGTISGGTLRTSDTANYWDTNFTNRAEISNGRLTFQSKTILSSIASVVVDGSGITISGDNNFAGIPSSTKTNELTEYGTNGLVSVGKSGQPSTYYMSSDRILMGQSLTPYLQFESDFYNTFIISRKHTLNILTDDVLKVANLANNAFRPVWASAFTVNSSEKYKQDIKLFEGSALQIISSSDIYHYRLKDDVLNGINKIRTGLVIGKGYNTPEQLIDGGGISQYEMSSLSFKAIQELDNNQKGHTHDIESLKLQNQYLTQRLNYLESLIEQN